MDKPKINGHHHSFASIEFTVRGVRITGVTAINYSDALDRGEVRGTSAQRLGFTRGDYTPEADFELIREEAERMEEALGDGLYDEVFDVTVVYADENAPTITDKLIGCRLAGIESGNTQSTDASTKAYELDLDHIVWNGRKPFKQMLS